MRRRSVPLNLELLEDRSVPSGTPLADPISVYPIAVIDPAPLVYHSTHPLAGIGQGTFTSNPLMVDAGAYYQLSGSGDFAKIGDASVSGSIQGVGMIAAGYASGTLVFTSAQGSVTISLEGLKQQSAFSPIPTWFRYQVVSATGAYEGLKDSGTVRIDSHQEPELFAPPFMPVGGPVPIFRTGGTFRIAI